MLPPLIPQPQPQLVALFYYRVQHFKKCNVGLISHHKRFADTESKDPIRYFSNLDKGLLPGKVFSYD